MEKKEEFEHMRSVLKILTLFLGSILIFILMIMIVLHIPHKVSVKGRWELLSQYENHVYYSAQGNAFEKKQSMSLNSYLVAPDDQYARPEKIKYTFTEDIDHEIVGVDKKGNVTLHQVVGKGTHTLDVDGSTEIISFTVHDKEESQFKLEGEGGFNTPDTSLSGRYFSVVGDSLSAYDNYIPEDNFPYYTQKHFEVQSMWWATIAKETGMVPCVINASSGSGVTQLKRGDIELPSGNNQQCEQLSRGEKTPDVIFVLIGANDWFQKIEEKKLKNEYTEMVQKMKEMYSKARIYLCTYFPMNVISDDELKNLNAIITSVGVETNTSVIDLSESDITLKKENEYYLKETNENGIRRVHLNEKGQRELGNYITQNLLNE